MRKSIFKRELESCFKAFQVSDLHQMEILKALFESPIDITKQYLLKKELHSLDHITNCIRSILDKMDFIADVRSLFEVDDDLELPDSFREQLARKEKIGVRPKSWTPKCERIG